MAWRIVSSLTINKMLCSWAYPNQRVWKLQSSCKQTRENLQTSYTRLTNIPVKQLYKTIDGLENVDYDIPYNDGMFQQYPEIQKALNKSKYICYRFSNGQHFVTYMYDQKISKWILLQGWQGVISLADCMNTLDEQRLMETTLTSMPTLKNLNPIDHPKTYWKQIWKQFMKKFELTQLQDNAQLKLKKKIQFGQILAKQNADGRIIRWIYCDGSP